LKQFVVVLSILVPWVAIPVESFANGWPRLIGGGEIVQCAEALQIGKATFQSNSFYLFSPPTMPAGIGSTVVLQPEAVDISGGNALKSEDAVFDKLPISHRTGEARNIYWETKANEGIRLVLLEEAFNWQGDRYSLFAIQAGVTFNEFLVAVKSGNKDSQFQPILGESWRPPLIFQEKRSLRTWAIAVGEPYYFLGNWTVFVTGADGVNHRCTVQFRPRVKNATSLLPAPVRKLAHLLDQTMGSGLNEGTLNPTARLRLAVQHTWASAALRPWALPEPYNSRAEVDAGLKLWSGGGFKYLETYKNLQKQYPFALQSLAQFYTKQFDHSAKDAKLLAEHVLDVAFRAHYTFHRE